MMAERERRAVVVGMIGVAAIVAASRVPSAIQWRSAVVHAHAEIASRSASAAALISAETAIRDSLTGRLGASVASDSAYLGSTTGPIAEAAFASWVAEFARATDVGLDAVQVRADTTPGRVFEPVVARLSATGDLESLASFLATVESGPLLVAVREVGLTQPEPGIPPSRKEKLRAEVVLETLTRAHTQSRLGGGGPTP